MTPASRSEGLGHSGSAQPSIGDRVDSVRARLAVAARRAGRDPSQVTLVAATKTVSAARVAEAVAAGVSDLGENRAQELLAKAPLVAEVMGAHLADSAWISAPTDLRAPHWHFLGTLQRNKVKRLAPWIACWESVDRLALGEVIARHAPGARVLVEVNISQEAQKSGCAPSDTGVLVDGLRGLGLAVLGLMAVPRHDDDPRRAFAAMRTMAEALDLADLSIGMSDDFEIAVEEGATIVRVGRAIFGDRIE